MKSLCSSVQKLLSGFKAQKVFPSFHLNQVSTQQKCPPKYSVFLNFRGRDTRDSFVHPLHAALLQRGISVFKDDIDLKKGEWIRQELFRAIKVCRVAIVILSKNYAASEWCLEELVKIMKRKKLTIFPVFYDVRPSDVHCLRGDFAQPFIEHQRNHEPKKLRMWKQALSNAAEISGFHLLNERGKLKCIEEIVEEVRKKVEPRREHHYATIESEATSSKECDEKMRSLRENVLPEGINQKIIKSFLEVQRKRERYAGWRSGGDIIVVPETLNLAMLEKGLVTDSNELPVPLLLAVMRRMKHNVIGLQYEDYNQNID